MNWKQIESAIATSKTIDELAALLKRVTAPAIWTAVKRTHKTAEVLDLFEKRNDEIAKAAIKAIEDDRQKTQEHINHVRKFPNAY